MRSKPKKKFNYPFDIMKWLPKNIHDAILPIMVLNWITGLSILEYPLGKPQPVITFIYVISINFFYWFLALNCKRIVGLDDEITRTGKVIFSVILVVNNIIAVASIIIGWCYYKVFKTSFQRLEQLDMALERLGLPNNCRKSLINSILKATIWLMVVSILLINDIHTLILKTDWLTCFQTLYIYHTPLHVNSVVEFTFGVIVHCLRVRFENINLLLKRHLEKRPEPKMVRELYPKYSRVSALVLSTEYSSSLRAKHLERQSLILIRQLHMELSEISWEINRIYEKQLLMGMGAYFIILTGLLYNFFITVFISSRPFQSKIKSIINAFIWCSVYAYKLLNIASICAKVTLEERKSSDILYELKNLYEDEELKEEIDQFSLQLIQRPLVFNLCGFMSIDYTFVQRFIGTVTTYLVILIQFSPDIND